MSYPISSLPSELHLKQPVLEESNLRMVSSAVRVDQAEVPAAMEAFQVEAAATPLEEEQLQDMEGASRGANLGGSLEGSLGQNRAAAEATVAVEAEASPPELA
jgi:hypothetical protein